MPATSLELGKAKLIEPEEAFKNGFSRFAGDELNGWNAEKHKYRGKVGNVTEVFGDNTATIEFDDGTSFDVPFEVIEPQVDYMEVGGSRISQEAGLATVTPGKVRLLSDPAAFKNAFHRFEGDKVNGWSEEKHAYVGKEGMVTETYADRTVTMAFDDSKIFDFPFDAIAEQVTTTLVNFTENEFGGFETQRILMGRVRLVADGAKFKLSFSRFEGDRLNGWTEEKNMLRGKECTVIKTYGDDTITALFGNGKKLDFPFESVDEQLTVDDIETKVFKNGRVRLVEVDKFRNAFGRFNDELNGWSQKKQNCAGQECTVVRVYGDKTVTLQFDDGEQFDVPFEAIDEQLEVDAIESLNFKCGRVLLKSDPEEFKQSFKRFVGDDLNGWSEAKHQRKGQECDVVFIYGDKTVTAMFDDEQKFDFPFESIAKQLTVEEGRQKFTIGMVRLVEDPEKFRIAFRRFNDPLNGWNTAKHKRRGQRCQVVKVYGDDTVTAQFDDGVSFDFPFEAIAEQLDKMSEEIAEGAVFLQKMKDCLEGETEIDSYDMLALEPVGPSNIFAGNKTRVVVCIAVQFLFPLLLLCHTIYEIVKDDGMSALCQANEGWNEGAFTKITTKIFASGLLCYMYNYLNTADIQWSKKPTHQMLMAKKMLTIMKFPSACGVGVMMNGFALIGSGLCSVAIVYASETPIDVVLNSLALFFVVDIDDQLVDKGDYERNVMRFSNELDRLKREKVPPIKPYPSFRTPIIVIHYLLQFTKYVVLVSPVYMLVCK